MKSPLSAINKLWNHISIWGKLLIVIVLFMAVYYMLPSSSSFKGKESFVNRKPKFQLKEGDEVYDGFYSQIYDYLVYSDVLDDYEIGVIIQKTEPDSHSIILDIGSGTGHTTSKLASNHQFKVKGLDKSASMVKQAQSSYPDVEFIHGDALRGGTFGAGSFTHILCRYFTIYYIQDKSRFFENCYKWLKPGGYLVVHVVDRDMFDPIIPPANPLSMLTPQRYAKERITTSKVTFDTFKYKSNFVLDPDADEAQFIEKFHFNDGRVRKNIHKMYMPTEDAIVRIGQDAGFVVQGDIDLIHAGYEYNHLILFYKPE